MTKRKYSRWPFGMTRCADCDHVFMAHGHRKCRDCDPKHYAHAGEGYITAAIMLMLVMAALGLLFTR